MSKTKTIYVNNIKMEVSRMNFKDVGFRKLSISFRIAGLEFYGNLNIVRIQYVIIILQ